MVGFDIAVPSASGFRRRVLLRLLVLVVAVSCLGGAWAGSALAVPPELADRSIAGSVANAGRSLAAVSYPGAYEGTVPEAATNNLSNGVSLVVTKTEVTGHIWWRRGDAQSCGGLVIEIGPGQVTAAKPPVDPTAPVSFQGSVSQAEYIADRVCPPDGRTVVTPTGATNDVCPESFNFCGVTSPPTTVTITITDGVVSGTFTRDDGALAFNATRGASGGDDPAAGGDEDEGGECRLPATVAAFGCGLVASWKAKIEGLPPKSHVDIDRVVIRGSGSLKLNKPKRTDIPIGLFGAVKPLPGWTNVVARGKLTLVVKGSKSFGGLLDPQQPLTAVVPLRVIGKATYGCCVLPNVSGLRVKFLKLRVVVPRKIKRRGKMVKNKSRCVGRKGSLVLFDIAPKRSEQAKLTLKKCASLPVPALFVASTKGTKVNIKIGKLD